MAVCKCFINDQLLPVRAGCEAIYCKDVNSDTAIRNEALSRITSLRAKVACLEAANAAKNAALREIEDAFGHLLDPANVEEGYTGEDWRAAGRQVGHLFENGQLRALSPDAGKGWLPPEWWKGKMFRHIPGVLSGACDPSCGACALDALKGVEADEAG